MRAKRSRVVAMALLLGAQAPLRASAQEVEPGGGAEAMRRQVGELGRTWAARYEVTDAELAEAQAAVPARLEWATCSKKDSPLRVSCRDRSAATTMSGCRAAAVAVLAERAAKLGRGQALPARTATEMTCTGHRVTLSARQDAGTEMKDEENGAGEVSGVDRGAAEGTPRSPSSSSPGSTAFEKPDIANRKDVAERMGKVFPPLLRDSTATGTTVVALFVDETGRVLNALVDRSSGSEKLDAASLDVARHMAFTPARVLGRPVAVWATMPLSFGVW